MARFRRNFVSSRRSFSFGGTEAGDHFGRAMGAANLGKGLEHDLVIGVPEEDGAGGSNMGVAHIVFGGSNGPSLIGSQTLVQPGRSELEADDRFGSAFAAGDFDGDGFNDLAVGVPNEDLNGSNTGAVNVLYGLSSGVSLLRFNFWAQDVVGIPGGGETDDRYGSALAAGDFGRSGQADLAVGGPGEDIDSPGFDEGLGEDNDDAGAVFVVYGSSPNGLSATSSNPAQIFDQESNLPQGERQRKLVTGGTDGDNLGAALTAWNFGRSSQRDLVMGAPGNIFDFGNFPSKFRSGAIIALYGSSGGLTTSGVQLIDQDTLGMRDLDEDGDRFGEAVY
jgi:hypothetical protein